MSTMQRFYDFIIASMPTNIEQLALNNLTQANPDDILNGDFLIWTGW